MKRLSWLLLVAGLSLSTVGFAPPAGAVPAPLDGSIPGRNVVCHNIRSTRLCASVSEARVRPGSYVTIYGQMRNRGVGVRGQIMRVVWSSNITVSCLGLTDETGLASCRTYVPARSQICTAAWAIATPTTAPCRCCSCASSARAVPVNFSGTGKSYSIWTASSGA